MLHAGSPKAVHCRFRIGFDFVRDHNISQILLLFCHMNNSPRFFRRLGFHLPALHQLVISGQNTLSVQKGTNAMPRRFLHILQPGIVNFFSICLHKGPGNRMIGKALRISRRLQHFFLRASLRRNNFPHPEHAFCKSSGLIHNNCFCIRERLQIITALN